MTSRYIPHIIYATAVTSCSMHLLNHRVHAAEERASYRAQGSVLVSIISRMKAGENLSDEEIARLRIMGDRKQMLAVADMPSNLKSTGWRDTLLGKKSKSGNDPEVVRKWEEYVNSLDTKP